MQEQEIPTTNEDVEQIIPVEYDNEPIQGINATIQVGTTTTGEAGTNASVENVGTETHAILDFTIPRGDKGERGDKGDKGDTGESATIQMNATATTLSAGSQATATITNSGDSHNANYTLALGIPQGIQGERGVQGERGERGERGEQGVQGIQGIQGETGEAFSIYKTYPSVADMNADASNVPEGKFTLIASNVDDPDNSKLFVKNGEGTFTYLTDMSGAQGIQGERGEQGIQGIQGIQGVQGETGARGSVKSQYVAELPATGDEDTFYLVDRDLESHTESGEYINLETTQTAAAIQSAEIDGNATQTTYSGKNLFNKDASFRGSGFTISTTSTGVKTTLSASGSGYTYGGITIGGSELLGKTLTLSAKISQSGGATPRLFLAQSNSTGVINVAQIGTSLSATGSQTYEIPSTFASNADSIALIIYANNAGQGVAGNTITYDDLQIESGSSATSYEPFVGGIPAPNPSYPQPISVVTGENTVKVEGKNLIKFAQDNGSTERAGVTVTVNSNNTLTINGTATTNAWFELIDPSRFLQGVAVSSTIFEQLDASRTYTLSANIISGGVTGTIPNITAQVGAGANDNKSSTFGSSVTFTGSDGIYRTWLRINSGNVFDNCQISTQLEIGSQATAFEPYTAQDYTIDLGSIELAKIGTYQDRIYKEGGKWYVEKQVSKVVLDGSESWNYVSSDNGYFQFNTPSMNVVPFDGNPATNALCDHFTPRSRWYVATGKVNLTINLSGSYCAIRYETYPPSVQGLADFKTWLSTHPTTVYYALATPTTTEITNQSLIDQLEALASAPLNQGVNNIFTEIATGNAMPTLELNWVEWEKYNRHNVYIWNDDIDDWQVIVQ